MRYNEDDVIIQAYPGSVQWNTHCFARLPGHSAALVKHPAKSTGSLVFSWQTSKGGRMIQIDTIWQHSVSKRCIFTFLTYILLPWPPDLVSSSAFLLSAAVQVGASLVGPRTSIKHDQTAWIKHDKTWPDWLDLSMLLLERTQTIWTRNIAKKHSHPSTTNTVELAIHHLKALCLTIAISEFKHIQTIFHADHGNIWES